MSADQTRRQRFLDETIAGLTPNERDAILAESETLMLRYLTPGFIANELQTLGLLLEKERAWRLREIGNRLRGYATRVGKMSLGPTMTPRPWASAFGSSGLADSRRGTVCDETYGSDAEAPRCTAQVVLIDPKDLARSLQKKLR